MSIDLNNDNIISLLNQLGFKTPTSIQIIAIPKIFNSELDMVVTAPTGSGKTEAVMIPILYKITRDSDLNSYKGIKVLYITPLRALNRDILIRLHNIANKFDLTAAIWHGDTSSSSRKKILLSPPDILITTPESLQILLIKKEIRDSLRYIYTVIVDEAQDLVSSERGTELSVALERIDNIVNRHVRRVLITSPIGDIDTLARYFFSGRRYDVAYARGTKRYSIDVTIIDKYSREKDVNWAQIPKLLCRNVELSNSRQLLIFTNTRTAAEELGLELSKCLGTNVALHHSSLSRDLRENVESMFKKGYLNIVISTSSLELGIDIGGVDLVLQYLSPRQALKLIQRVGRAGHRESSISRGIIVVPSIVTELIESIVIARRAINGILEMPEPHIKSLDVLAHQVAGLVLERGEVGIDEIWRIIASSTAFNTITISELEDVINLLNLIGLIRCSDRICKITKKGQIYYLTTNMMPDTTNYIAKSIVDSRTIGLLDEEFALACNEGDIIVLGGKLWEIVNVDIENREVVVSPIESSNLVVLPKWIGEMIPVHRGVAREVCAFIRRFCGTNNNIYLDKLFNEYNITEDVKSFLKENKDRLCTIYPRDDMLIIEVNRMIDDNKTLISFYTCLGSKASEAFSLLIDHIVRELYGVSVAHKSHQLGSILLVNAIVDNNILINIIKKLRQYANKPELIRDIIEKEVKNTTFFRLRLISVAKKFGVIDKRANSSEIKRIIDGLMNIDMIVKESLREIYTEKVDVYNLLEYLNKLNKIRIKVYIHKTPSVYLDEMASLSVFRSLVKHSLIPKDIMIEMVKRRLLDKEITMFCTTCYYMWSIKLSQNVTKCENIFSCPIECPYCRSRAITIVGNELEASILKKVLNKIRTSNNVSIKLLSNEKEIMEKHKKLTDFILNHGLAGIITLQGIGIGIETAKRIIAKSLDIDSLILNIIKREKIFLRTSRYWQK